MKVDCQKLSYEQVPQFSQRDKDYVLQQKALRAFYKFDFDFESK